MKNINNRSKIWLILTPILVVAFMFLSAYLSVIWYQNELYKNLKNSSEDTNLVVIYNQLDRQINDIVEEDRVIFNGENPYINDKRLISYFQFSLDKKSDYIFLFRMDKKLKKLKVIYSSSPNIEVGSYIPKNKYIILDDKTIDSLLKIGEYYSNSSYDKTNTLYKLFKYYPRSNLVVSTGSIMEKHSISYERNIKIITKDTNQIRLYIMGIEFIASLIGAFFVSLIIKRVISNFNEAQIQLVKTNESLKLSNTMLERQLLINSLTKLPNKRSMIEDMKSMSMPKLILVDIDEFRKMTEYYCNKTIEKIIMHVKNILSSHIDIFSEYGIKLYHIDTSQFALLENAPYDTERYEMLALKLSSSLKGAKVKCHRVDGYAEFNCTIGFSLEDTYTYETAITALRRAIENEKDYVCYLKIFSEEGEFERQIQGAKFIKKALENDKVVPFFQPIFDKDVKILKYECLVRIIDDDENILSPYMFLDTSKKIKRYVQIEKALIKKSFDAIQDTDKVVSINLSSRDMVDSDVKNFVLDEISKRKIANQIIFEILEDESIKSIDRVMEFINRVKAMGVRIAIDDFGSGYSNYSYMLNLRPDYVKIDGTLIKNIDHDHISHAIVSSIILFTKRLGIRTIAEYVHSKEVFEVCKDLGIDEFQGFYLSEPKEHLL